MLRIRRMVMEMPPHSEFTVPWLIDEVAGRKPVDDDRLRRGLNMMLIQMEKASQVFRDDFVCHHQRWRRSANP